MKFLHGNLAPREEPDYVMDLENRDSRQLWALPTARPVSMAGTQSVHVSNSPRGLRITSGCASSGATGASRRRHRSKEKSGGGCASEWQVVPFLPLLCNSLPFGSRVAQVTRL